MRDASRAGRKEDRVSRDLDRRAAGWRGEPTWRSLRLSERGRVLWAMTRGRPLPPRLARAASEHARHPGLATFMGCFYLVIAVGWLVSAAVGSAVATSSWSLGLRWFLSIGFVALGTFWLAIASNSRRAIRAGHWPQH